MYIFLEAALSVESFGRGPPAAGLVASFLGDLGIQRMVRRPLGR